MLALEKSREGISIICLAERDREVNHLLRLIFPRGRLLISLLLLSSELEYVDVQ
jgi:hypothetical protein